MSAKERLSQEQQSYIGSLLEEMTHVPEDRDQFQERATGYTHLLADIFFPKHPRAPYLSNEEYHRQGILDISTKDSLELVQSVFHDIFVQSISDTNHIALTQSLRRGQLPGIVSPREVQVIILKYGLAGKALTRKELQSATQMTHEGEVVKMKQAAMADLQSSRNTKPLLQRGIFKK